MSKNFNNFKDKFRLSNLTIHQSDYWTWSVRPVQATVGAGVLSLNRPVEEFSQMSTEESADLKEIISLIEITLKAAYGYQRINYLMLMMVDYQVHFHVIPRYESTIDFADISWTDKGWPKPPLLDADPVSDEVLYAIRDHLRSTLKQ